MMSRKLFRGLSATLAIFSIFVLGASIGSAMTASPHPFTETQPGGMKITLYGRGDEYFHWLEDANGYTVLKNGTTYVYAQLDAAGQLIPTSLIVGTDNPANAGIKPKTLPPPTVMTQLRSSSPLSKRGGPAPGLDSTPTTGTIKNIVILMRFSDHTGRTQPNPGAIDTLFNAVGGDPTYAPTGSVRDLYLANSFGKMTLNSTIVAWVTLSHTEAYYANGNSGLDPKIWEAITESLTLADPLINFSQFDQNDDGYVDSIAFLHSGYGAEWIATDAYGTPYTNRIWSHRWSLGSPFVSAEGVRVSDYHISPAIWDVSGSAIGHIGVICHETGHFFGLPDLYDTTGGGEGLGSYCMMANSWGFTGDQLNPPYFSAWSKLFLNWITPTAVSSFGTYTVPRAEDNPKVFKVTNGYPAGEYLLIENRQPYSFESTMPQGGLAIYHVDEAKPGNTDEGYPGQVGWPQNNQHYMVALLQADGQFGLEQGFNRGDGGDVYHAAGQDHLDQYTTPNTDAYQSGSIATTGNRIYNISASASSMTFQFGTPAFYYGNVGRLLQTKCMQCHHTGSVGTFSMETYAQTFPYASDMAAKASARLMPPWNASPDQTYDPLALPPKFISGDGPGKGFWHSRALTQEQINLLVQWNADGAPAGDPSDAAPNPVFNDEWENGTPDVVLTQTQPWTLNPGDPDIYRCFVIPTGFIEDKTMIGLEVKPSNPKIAHHAILFLDPYNNGPARDAQDGGPNDGWTCFGGADLDGAVGLGGWAPGGNLQPFSDKLGSLVPAGSNIILQMHYSASKVGVNPETDQTQLGLKVTTDPNVQQLIQFPPTRLDFVIPESSFNYPVTTSYISPFDIHMVGVFPHMHLYGKKMKVTATKPDGSTLGLINVDKWDFDWQNHYLYNKPIGLPAGTQIDITGYYDNPTNQPVYGGEFTTNEMLLLGLSFTTDAAIPGLGQGGVPASHDYTPPSLLGTTVGSGSTIFTMNFSEPVAVPPVPGVLDFKTSGGLRVTPDNVQAIGNQLKVTFNNLPLGYYKAYLNAFFGIHDLAGNYLDTNGNGIGGEIADDKVIPFNNYKPLQIVRQPSSQAVNQGENVLFGVQLSGDQPITSQWKRADFSGETNVSGGSNPTVTLNNVNFLSSAFYHYEGSNPSAGVVSNAASLTVFYPVKSNSASFVNHTIPTQMMPGQALPGGVRMKNTSQLTWSSTQGYKLAILSDTGGFFGGATRIDFPSVLDVVPSGSGQWLFSRTMTAPLAPGNYSVQFQMIEEGKGLFGPVVTANIQVGSVFQLDFTNNTQNWLGSVNLGTATTSVGASGICMQAPANGDNIAQWSSPPYSVPLVDNAAYAAELTVSTDQTAANAIPLWDFSYVNSLVAGKGNNYGGSAWVLDVAGGANGIGRPAGRTMFKFFFAPNAALTQQWRGIVDPANSAFAPAADTYNDMELRIRVLDIGSSGFNANADSGTICLKSLKITRYSIPTLTAGATRLWGPPINSATHKAQEDYQAAENAGLAVIDNLAATALYSLASGFPADNNGKGARKTLIPYDPTQANDWGKLYPVTWSSNALYLGTAMIRSNVGGGSGAEGTDPVKVVLMNFAAATNELGESNFTTRGSKNNLKLAASPRQKGTTGGSAQPYIAFFFGQNASASALLNAQRFRFTPDFINNTAIAPFSNGADGLAVESMTVDQLVVP